MKENMKSPSTIPFQSVLNALLDADHTLKPRYLYRLSDMDEADVKKLAHIWANIPLWRRQALMEDVEELAEQDNLLSFEALSRLAVKDPDALVRLPATRILWEFETRDLIPIFSALASQDNDEQVRAAATTGLGKFIYLGEIEEIPAQLLHEVEEQLLKIYHHDTTDLVRRRALEALAFSNRDELPPLIEAAYSSGVKEWVASALFAMGRSANERWQPQVLAMLDNSSAAIRTEAVRAAGELECSSAVPRLLELLEDPDDIVRMASIWSLSQLGGEGVGDALEKLYDETEDEEEAEYLQEALDNLAFTEETASFMFFDLPEGADNLDEELWDIEDTAESRTKSESRTKKEDFDDEDDNP